VSNPTKNIKTSACLGIIRVNKKYLSIAVHCLKEEVGDQASELDRVYILCDYVSSLKKTISFFETLVERSDGKPSIAINYAQAIMAKACIENVKSLKLILMDQYNLFVEIH